MSGPGSSKLTHSPLFLENSNLLDENCAFIDNISEHADDIVEWFDKSNDELVLDSSSMIGSKPDPLLIQINSSDSPTLLHLSDTESLGDICMSILDSPKSDYYDQSLFAHCSTKTDKNMNSLSNENAVNNKESKCDILECLVKEELTIEIVCINDKLQVKISNVLGQEVFPAHFILPIDGVHVSRPLMQQPIKLLEKTTLALLLDVRMPCLHSELGLRIWFCPQADCRRAFYRINVAKLHALQHLDHKPYKCDFEKCDWAFFTSFKLRRHQETHSKKKDFACSAEGCNRRFTTVYNLKWHCRHQHERPATIPCLVKGCDKYFHTMRARELHVKEHGKDEAPYKCPVLNCNKRFFLYTALSTHARVHSHTESELRCQWTNCGRVFEQPCRLKQHMLKHTGQRPFMCTFDECKWAFSTASKLKRHLSTHTNERKFHCTMGSCNKSFLRSEHLREHTLTHIGQRPFHCDECDATFTGKSGLYLHMKKNHPKNNKACARALPYQQQRTPKKLSSEDLLKQAVQSLNVPSDMMLATSLLPEEPLPLLENHNFSTVNLRDLD